MRRLWIVVPATILVLVAGIVLPPRFGIPPDPRSLLPPQAQKWTRQQSWPFHTKPQPLRVERPPGMAPIAFDAFIRACVATKIHPLRIGQTMGNHPRSVGYHRQDGVVNVRGEKISYCAAVDLGAQDLDRATTLRFVRELGRQGFAVWYREGPKWRNGEHIHAVYAFLPMKPQLRRQVLLYLREQRSDGSPIWWEKKLRRTRQFRRYF